MLVYYYGNCSCAELSFLFSQHCLLSHLLGRIQSCVLFPLKPAQEMMLGRNVEKLIFIWCTKASRWQPATEDVKQGVTAPVVCVACY